jgi:hypothetical protein
MMKSRKKARAGRNKRHHLRTKRKGMAKGKKVFKIGRSNRRTRVTTVEVEPDMTIQERSLSKIWDNQYDEAWNKYAPVSAS